MGLSEVRGRMLDMDITDVFGLAWRTAGRRIRQGASAVLIILLLCHPSAITTALTWYATHRAHQLEREVQRIIPTPEATVTPGGTCGSASPSAPSTRPHRPSGRQAFSSSSSSGDHVGSSRPQQSRHRSRCQPESTRA